MKKAVIGGFLSLLGTIWGLAVILFVGDNLVSGWATPPGRFLATVMATGMTFPLYSSFWELRLWQWSISGRIDLILITATAYHFIYREYNSATGRNFQDTYAPSMAVL